MVDNNLISYVKQQRAAGYTDDQIRQAMISYGYNPDGVEEALKAGKGGVNIPVVPIAIGAGVILIIIVIIFMFSGREEERLLDLKTSSLIDEITAGEIVSFNVELINMGTGKRYDTILTHEVIDNSGKVINSKQETLAVETRTSSTSNIVVPSTASSGEYKLMTTADYDSKTVVSFFMFNVVVEEVEEEEEEVEMQCPARCDDYDDCTRDICDETTGYRCAQYPITPCCGNDVCEIGEDYAICSLDCAVPLEDEEEEEEEEVKELSVRDIISTSKDYAAEDPAKAVGFCNGLGKEHHRDSCYNAVAEETDASDYCSKILSETSRDNCYTNFALAGDYSVCEKLINKYLKASCISLSQAS